MPLAWAHAEYIKLVRSIALGHAIDRPEAAWRRYEGRRPAATRATWRFTAPRPTMVAGRTLRFEVLAPCRVHYSLDGWRTVLDLDASDTEFGVWVADIRDSPPGARPRGGRDHLLAGRRPLGGQERAGVGRGRLTRRPMRPSPRANGRRIEAL